MSETVNERKEPLDLRYVFPFSKIRAEIRKDEDIGKITKAAVEFIAASSAAFVEELAQNAQAKAALRNTSSSNQITVTSDHIREVIHGDSRSYDFLLSQDETETEMSCAVCVIDDVKEENVPPLKKRKIIHDSKETACIAKAKDKNNPKNRTKSAKAWIKKNRDQLGIVTGNENLEKTITETSLLQATGGEIVEDTDDYD